MNSNILIGLSTRCMHGNCYWNYCIQYTQNYITKQDLRWQPFCSPCEMVYMSIALLNLVTQVGNHGKILASSFHGLATILAWSFNKCCTFLQNPAMILPWPCQDLAIILKSPASSCKIFAKLCQYLAKF